MNPSQVQLLAFLIGAIAGLRTMTAPAVVTWAANRHWLNLDKSALAWMGSTAAVGVFTLLALGELVFDKRPSTPNRTGLRGLIGRSVLGGLSGAGVAAALEVPDFVIALLEDAVAIALGLLIASRF